MHDFVSETINPIAGPYGPLRRYSYRAGSPAKSKPKPFVNKLKPNGLNYEAGYAIWPDLLKGYDPFYNSTGSNNTPRGTIYPDVRSYKRELMNLAENDFIEKLGAVRVNALDMWRTRKESANMIGSTIFRIAQAGLALKKGKWKRCCEILGIKKKKPKESSFPSQWLEYSYGWAPLYGDCYIIANDMLQTPASQVFGKARGAWSDVQTMSAFVSSTFDRFVKGLGTAVGFVTIDEPAMAALSQYGVLNPFAVAWEAVPFSFVVDWFIPIGDYINQFNVTSGLKITDYNVTGTVVQTCIGSVFGSSWVFQPPNQTGRYISKAVSKTRDLKPRPEFHFPRITNPLDFHPTRIANALALLTTVFLQRS